jgi:hypothetical protein
MSSTKGQMRSVEARVHPLHERRTSLRWIQPTLSLDREQCLVFGRQLLSCSWKCSQAEGYVGAEYHPTRCLWEYDLLMHLLGFASWQLDMHSVSKLLTEIDELDPGVDRVIGPFSIFRALDISLHSAMVKSQPSPTLSPIAGTFCLLNSQMQVLPDALSASSTVPCAARLFHHYTSHVTHLLQPVLHAGNFYNSVYVPRAISGAWDLTSNTSMRRASWSTRSIFFSILATSAFHRGVEIPSGSTPICDYRPR